MQLLSVYAHNFQLGHFNSNCLSSHGWMRTLAFWPLSWPVTSSLFDLKYWGRTWLVMWSVSSLARYWFCSQTASGILLCSVCSQFGEASVKRCCASLFQTAIISMLQAWLEVNVSVLASFLASDILSFWFEVLGANMVGDVVCVLLRDNNIFPNCFWDTHLQCLQPIWRGIS